MDDLRRIANPHHGGLPQFSSDIRQPAAGVFSHLKTPFEADQPISTHSSAGWWPEFHLFEAPRRRVLSSSSNAPPSTVRFCLLCALWYSSSALSSNTGKAILNQFRYPVTLTFVQFAFVAGYCLLFTSPLIQFSRLKSPTKAILESTLPMGAFQVGGHILSSVAISRIPVSTTHTIKALSPLFTVIAYAMLFGVKYSWKTYLSLLPLTLGVMLVCSFETSASNLLGLFCAFASAIVFVSSNIFFKKVMPSPSQSSRDTSHKLDKLNLLLYSSGMAFFLMIPVWMYYDLPVFMSTSQRVSHPAHATVSTSNLLWNFFINGTVHFGQNIIAFIILSSTSPVTYSIASLFKRVAVICIAILWFNQSVHPVQGVGIVSTFIGLWMYNNARGDVEKGEKKVRRVEAARELMLPSNRADHALMHSDNSPALSDNEEELFSVSSGVNRNALVSPISNKPLVLPHASAQKDLHIKVALPPLYLHQRKVESPVDSYPSPPLSHDSPPSTTSDLPTTEPPRGRRKRIMPWEKEKPRLRASRSIQTQTALHQSPPSSSANNMSSRPFPLNVYHSKRRQRSISNPQGRPVLSSSPMKAMSTEDEDITITEMTHRMKKKSRASLKRLFSADAPKAASVGTSPSDCLENSRPAKRSKVQAQRTPLAELARMDNNAHSMLLNEGTQDMDMTNIAELRTPAISPGPTKPPKLKAPATDAGASEQDEESDFLSPLPTSKFAKRVTAHRSSSSLKDAARKDTDGYLASPFNSRPGSPGHASKENRSKENRDKRINRTRSVGTDLRRRAALRSLSRAESPASNASSPGIAKSSGTQAWTVPAHVKHSISQKTPRRLSETSVLPASDASFFDFSPIACSTPNTKSTLTPPTRRDVDTTPKFPPLNFDAFSEIHDSMILDDPTPRAPLHTDSLLLAHVHAQPFASVQERIISSASANSIARSSSAKSDSSKSLTISGSSTLAPPSSPTHAHTTGVHGIISPATTGGGELHDMFSILELEEDEAWNQAHPGSVQRPSAGRRAPRVLRGATERKKRSSLSARDRDERLDNASSALKRSSMTSRNSSRRVSIELPASSASRARTRAPTKKPAAQRRERAMSPQLAQQGASGQKLPTVRMRILNSPIVPSSDSSDELLLRPSRPHKKN